MSTWIFQSGLGGLCVNTGGVFGVTEVGYNAPAHKTRIVTEFLQQHWIETMPHPGYPPDLSLLDYWLFARLKKMV